MSTCNQSIWFWQRIRSPHMAGLAKALAKRGFQVTFVANELISTNRAQQGWEEPDLDKVTFKLAENKKTVLRLALEAPEDSIHLCQGLRSNGLVGIAQRVLRKRSLNHWALMEVVDDSGWLGLIKRGIYRLIFLYWRNHLSGVLAIGNNALDWFAARGMKKECIYNFAYFLKNPQADKLYELSEKNNESRPFRFVFVGRLVKLKNVDYLINAIAALKSKEVELWIVGNGPEKDRLRLLADSMLPSQVQWFGTLPISNVPSIIRQADCLVLPSRYDGWGAVVSESLMVGTPVICSNACGVSAVVQASGVGGVFNANDIYSLTSALKKQILKGHYNDDLRYLVSKWSKCLDAESGAEYLEQIISNVNKDLITEPWVKKKNVYEK